MSRLQQLIQNSGMSQTEVAKEAKIDPATLSQYLNQPDKIQTAKVETIVKLCNVLCCNPIEIIGGMFWATQEWDTIKQMESYTYKELFDVFTEAEKHYLCDMLNGSMYAHKINPTEYLKMQIVDSDIYDSLASKWNVEINPFIKKVNSLSSFQCYMVIKTVSHYWDDVTKGKQPNINTLFSPEF